MYGRAVIALAGLVAVAACGRSDTGVEISLRVGQLEFDELRFRVTRVLDAPGEGSPMETLVDPDTNGRYVAPFRPGDQSVIVYVADTLDGTVIHCEATAVRAGVMAAAGATDVTVERGKIKNVEIVLSARTDSSTATGAAGAGGPPAGTGAGGAAGGSSGGGGGPPAGTGTGGARGGNGGNAGAPSAGTGGSGPSTGAGGVTEPARVNGQTCSIGRECLSGYCRDGVCCESACDGACQSCNQSGTAGLCRPIPAGIPDPHGVCADEGPSSCGTTGLCDVSGRCARYAAGTVCAVAICKNKEMLNPLATCDGSGTCQQQPAIKCDSGCAAGICL